MELSEAGLELLKRSEGFRGQTYTDAAGYPTIGYGHKLLPSESFPDGITEVQAAEMLLNDVRRAAEAVERLVQVPLTQGQFDALVDFCYNLGQGKLAASTLLRQLNSSNYDEASQELLRWDHAGSRELAGLKVRREAELALWNSSTETA